MKTGLIILSLLAAGNSFSQDDYFVVTAIGLRSAADSTRTYVIIPIDSPAGFLYSRSLKYLAETFKNPDLITKARTENEYLRYEVYAPAIIQFSIKKQKFPINAEYTVELKFKPGAVRVEFSGIKMVADNDQPLYWVKTGSNWKGWSRQHIFDTDGSIEHMAEKRQLEDYFNKEVQLIREFILKKDSW